jgi:hypothetical protein
VTKIIFLNIINLMAPEAGAKNELLLNKGAFGWYKHRESRVDHNLYRYKGLEVWQGTLTQGEGLVQLISS